MDDTEEESDFVPQRQERSPPPIPPPLPVSETSLSRLSCTTRLGVPLQFSTLDILPAKVLLSNSDASAENYSTSWSQLASPGDSQT